MNTSQLLESINQNINEGIYRSDRGGLIYVNKAFAKMFGYSSEEEVLTASTPMLYKEPDERARLVEKLLDFGSFENEELTMLKKGGQEFVALISSVIYRDDEGNIFWDGAVRDVTELRETSRLAKASDRQLQNISKNINEGIYRSIHGKGAVYVNDEFVRMFGFTRQEEVYDLPITELYKNVTDRENLIEELLSEGSISNREVELKRRDGTTFWGYMSSIKSIGDDGAIFFDGAIRDITMQKESAEALKRHAAMQEVLINLSSKYINLPVELQDDSIVSSLEELGRFVNADRAYIFEYDLESKLYSNTFEWNRKGVEPVLEQSQGLKMADYPALVNDHLEGKPIFIPDVSILDEKKSREMLLSQGIKSLITVPMMNEEHCMGFVGFDSVRNFRSYTQDEVLLLKVAAEMLVNIFTRAKNQKQLEHLLITANSQNKRLKEFSYITSHNFRSSVANLISLTQALQLDPTNSEYFDMLKMTTNKLSETIDNINELLNFENEISLLEREKVNLFQTVEGVLELNNQIIKENGIVVDVEISKNLTLEGSSAYFISIFHNLISNAIKYGTVEGSKRIEIFAKKLNKEILVTIKDHGLGIDLGRFGKKMFKLGSRFHSKESEGQGMGLFMTKQQVEAMGGRIDLESEVNKGTMFKLYFNG
ncbi:MAG: PAS domain-containing protein [Cyclobacteriaceae bacterium]